MRRQWIWKGKFRTGIGRYDLIRQKMMSYVQLQKRLMPCGSCPSRDYRRKGYWSKSHERTDDSRGMRRVLGTYVGPRASLDRIFQIGSYLDVGRCQKHMVRPPCGDCHPGVIWSLIIVSYLEVMSYVIRLSKMYVSQCCVWFPEHLMTGLSTRQFIIQGVFLTGTPFCQYTTG